MSDEKNNPGTDEKKNPGNAVQNIIATLKDNPKAIYAVIGALAVIGLVMALGGGGGQVQVKTAAAPGQTIVLQNPNGGDTQLNAIPGLVSVAQSEEDEKQIVCHVAAGTPAVVEEEQSVVGLPFVKVQVKDGPCQGKSGWASKINIQAR